MVLKEQRFHSIMDIYAFRVIVNDSDTCYRVLGQMHSLYKPRPGRVKDYIAIPKANGYQSLLQAASGPRERLYRHSKSERLSVFAHLDDWPARRAG